MRTREEIEVDIVQVEAQAATARHNASDWQKTAKACEDSLSRLRAELAALPPAPVRLIIQYDVENYIDIGVANEPWVATVCKSRCGQHKIDPQALAAHILTFNQPDPNAEALARLPLLEAVAEAVRTWHAPWKNQGRDGFTKEGLGMIDALAALDSVKGWADPNAEALAAADALAGKAVANG